MDPLGTLLVWLSMPLLAPLVVVEMVPDKHEQAGAVVESCNEALGSSRCTAGPAEAGAADYSVRVVWTEDGLGARVELRRRSAPDRVRTRELRFTGGDTPAQRAEAVGLVVAAYVLETSRQTAAPPAADPPPPAPSADATWRWGAQLAALAGPGLDRGPWRLGGRARGLLHLWRTPLAATMSVDAARRFASPSLDWLGGSAGVLLELDPASPWLLEARAEAAVERVMASARDEDGGRRESDARLRLGPRLGFSVGRKLGAGVAVLLGVETEWLFPGFSLEVQGVDVGHRSPFRFGLMVAARLSD